MRLRNRLIGAGAGLAITAAGVAMAAMADDPGTGIAAVVVGFLTVLTSLLMRQRRGSDDGDPNEYQFYEDLHGQVDDDD